MEGPINLYRIDTGVLTLGENSISRYHDMKISNPSFHAKVWFPKHAQFETRLFHQTADFAFGAGGCIGLVLCQGTPLQAVSLGDSARVYFDIRSRGYNKYLRLPFTITNYPKILRAPVPRNYEKLIKLSLEVGQQIELFHPLDLRNEIPIGYGVIVDVPVEFNATYFADLSANVTFEPSLSDPSELSEEIIEFDFPRLNRKWHGHLNSDVSSQNGQSKPSNSSLFAVASAHSVLICLHDLIYGALEPLWFMKGDSFDIFRGTKQIGRGRVGAHMDRSVDSVCARLIDGSERRMLEPGLYAQRRYR